MKVAAFDWDGTLVHHGSKSPNYEDMESVMRSTKPRIDALAKVKALIDSGTEVHIVTGRGNHLRTLTLVQIRHYLQRDFPVDRLHNQSHWEGYDRLEAYKAGVLATIKPQVFVGDHSCDQGAAMRSNVPFIHADNWAKEPVFLPFQRL